MLPSISLLDSIISATFEWQQFTKSACKKLQQSNNLTEYTDEFCPPSLWYDYAFLGYGRNRCQSYGVHYGNHVCAHSCVCLCRWRLVYHRKCRRSCTQLYLCFFGIRGDPTLSKRYPNLPSRPNQHTHSRSSCGTIDLAVCWFNRSGCLLKGDWEGLLWCPKAWEDEGGRGE